MPPRMNEYLNHLPVGWWFSGGTATVNSSDGLGSSVLITPTDANGTLTLLKHTEAGYYANGVDYCFNLFSVPAVQEDTQAFSAKMDSAYPPIYHTVGPVGRTGAVGTGIDAEYFQQAPAVWTQANADALAGPIVANYQDHGSLLAYNLGDDQRYPRQNTLGHPYHAATIEMAKALQRADPHGRPAMFVHVYPNQGNMWADMGDDLKLALTYRYPIGRYANGVAALEGDFRRSTFAGDGVGNWGGPTGGNDWIDGLRQWLSYLPDGVPIWIALQAHATAGTESTKLREPTIREYRKQFWIALGEGFKGIFWFAGDNVEASQGILDRSRQDVLGVTSELSRRLTKTIRKKLLASDKIADAFTASGGGSSGYTVNYPNAYISTLQSRLDDNVKYVIVCNNSLSTANVTINSATLKGTLTNQETGEVYHVGETISLPALDGTIFEYRPFIGVPHKEPDFGFATVEAWWDTHWANPLSSKYIPVGTIQTHPKEVVVNPSNIQAAINAAVGPTTFVIEPGDYMTRITIIGKGHLHFVAQDPEDRPNMTGFDIYGTTYATRYNTWGTNYGYPHHLRVLKTPAALEAHRNPTRDFLFRDINFKSNGDLVVWDYFKFPSTNMWDHDHWYSNAAIGCRAIQDLLIERCSAEDYIAGNVTETRTVPFADPPPSPFDLGLSNLGHPGVFWGNSGIRCVTIRDVDIAAPSDTRGFPYSIFFDGPQGCVFTDIRLTGKWRSADFLYLTNDDYCFDVDYNGAFERGRDFRNAWCNVIYDVDSDKFGIGQTNGAGAFMGGNNLIKDYVIRRATGSFTFIVEFACKLCLQHPFGQYYMDYGNVVDHIDVQAGGCTNFVQTDQDQGLEGGHSGGDPTYRFRSRIGLLTIKNNHVQGSVTNWIGNKDSPPLVTIDTPNVLFNNTTG